MKKVKILPIFLLFISGCAIQYPKSFLQLSDTYLQTRQLQMRQFETTNEKEILSACTGVLQDMGYTLDDSESTLGLVVASKDRDATNAGQVAAATLSVLLSGLSGSQSNAFDYIDKTQKIRASIVTKLNNEGNRIVVRVTFQRIVWNNIGNVSRMENLTELELYQGFFSKLSKAVFLEEEKI